MNALGATQQTFAAAAAGAGTAIAQDALGKSFETLTGKGYRFTPDDGGPPPRTIKEALVAVSDGRALNSLTPNATKEWPIDSPEKLAEYVFSEDGQIHNLPEPTQKEFATLNRLARNKVKLYSNATNSKACIIKAVQLWKFREGTLWAEHNGQQRERINDLDDFCKRHNIATPPPRPMTMTPPSIAPQAPPAFVPQAQAPSAPPAAFVTPAAAFTASAPPPAVAPTPPAPTPPPQAEQPPVVIASAPTPPPIETVARPAAPPPPPVTIIDLNQLHAAHDAPPPEPEAPPEPTIAMPGLWDNSVITPFEQTAEVARAAKVKGNRDGSVVKKEYLFILPPGQSQLTKIAVPPTQALMQTLEKNGVSFIYMNVMAPTKGKHDHFVKEHGLVSRLVNERDGAIPANVGQSRNLEARNTSVRDFLVALPGDYEDKACHFPANLEMATALAASKTPVAFIRLSGSNGKALDVLNNFLEAHMAGDGTDAQVPAKAARAAKKPRQTAAAEG